MNTNIRRYVFIDFETLQHIKFKKLEKVCDKIFVFVDSATETIPFPLVRDMQKMGSAVKWVEVSAASPNDLNFHICFLMGKLHEKISNDIEFAILSNDSAFDPLVQFINSTGRNCLRIRPTTTTAEPSIKPDSTVGEKPLRIELQKSEAETKVNIEELSKSLFDDLTLELTNGVAVSDNHSLIDETARETIERLMRSGNRPHSVAMLRSYILLHNQELSQHGNVDKIIKALQAKESILINNGDIQYHF
ncbi:MAG: PIN domain-containing protein [Saprospiraceae bacterium]|nr:PIN domain-containing protein [Saprospiraceae bacterium]